MEQFGIFAPVMGLREDIPSILLPQAATEDNGNVRFQDGEIQRIQMPVKMTVDASNDPVAPPDSNPFLLYYYFEKDNGTSKYLLGFTKDHIYWWDATNYRWGKVGSAGYLWEVDKGNSSCEDWSVITFNDQCIATNNVDKVIVWDGTGVFDELGSASGLQYDATPYYIMKAKCIASFSDYILLGNVTVTGGAEPHAIYWCSIGDESDWETGDSGSLTIPGSDLITAFAHLQDYLLVFKEYSYYRLWFVVTDPIFNLAAINHQIGTLAPQSIINGRQGELYFLGSDFQIHVLRGAAADAVISDPITTLLRTIAEDAAGVVRAHYIPRYNLILWATPYGTQQTTNNIVFAYQEGRWAIYGNAVSGEDYGGFAISAFGVYARTSGYTIDTLPYPTPPGIDGIPATGDLAWSTIDSLGGQTNERPDLCSDQDGYTYALFANPRDMGGNAFVGHAVLSTDLADKKRLAQFKRLLRMTVYFRAALGASDDELDVSIRLDRENGWRSVGSVAMAARQPNQYQPGTTYTTGDAVYYRHWVWTSLQDGHHANEPVVGSAYWEIDCVYTGYDEEVGEIIGRDLWCDYVGRHFFIKISADNAFEFVGITFEFMPLGTR